MFEMIANVCLACTMLKSAFEGRTSWRETESFPPVCCLNCLYSIFPLFFSNPCQLTIIKGLNIFCTTAHGNQEYIRLAAYTVEQRNELCLAPFYFRSFRSQRSASMYISRHKRSYWRIAIMYFMVHDTVTVLLIAYFPHCGFGFHFRGWRKDS